MDFTLTLVASNKALSAGHLAQCERFTAENGLMITGDPIWLSEHKAADIPLAECLNIEQMKAIRELFEEDQIDIFCTRTDDRRKTLLLADMDSTIVISETLDELAAEIGLKDKISSITERAMKGELDFHAALKERVALLAGLETDALERTLKGTVISDGAAPLVKTMSNEDGFCVLVSGGFTYFTSAIAKKLGFTTHHGNILDIENDKLTGKVKDPILDKDAKLRFLKLYCEETEVDISNTVAIGDGANDLPMLQAAGLGIGYRPKPLLEETLLNCIRFSDLTSVLYAQGYTDAEILS